MWTVAPARLAAAAAQRIREPNVRHRKPGDGVRQVPRPDLILCRVLIQNSTVVARNNGLHAATSMALQRMIHSQLYSRDFPAHLETSLPYPANL